MGYTHSNILSTSFSGKEASGSAGSKEPTLGTVTSKEKRNPPVADSRGSPLLVSPSESVPASAPSKPHTAPSSGLASSLPSIATMLNSPVRHQVVPVSQGVSPPSHLQSPAGGNLSLSPQKAGSMTAGLTLSLQKSPQQGAIYSITSQPLKPELQAVGVTQACVQT